MVVELMLIALILVLCIIADKFSGKFGMPALILFIGIGMLFGSDGIVKIPFDNFAVTEQICTIALGFIMFYGGFNTKWKAAKPVAVKSLLLSTAGVFLTGFLTMAFCCVVLKFRFAEGFLLGAVISCTDAASVFSILRKKKLNLKDGVASLLEIESGSNDPTAYMLTVVGISLVNGENLSTVPYAIFAQIVYGVAIGVVLAVFGIWVLTKTRVVTNGMYTVFILALVLFGMGFSSLVGGNAFLSIYLLGILMGNSSIRNKKEIIPFFDGVTGLSQIVIFFLLGLLSFPHKFPYIMEFSVRAFYSCKEDVSQEMNSMMNDQIERMFKEYFKNIDLSKFKEDADPNRILHMLIWMADGYMHQKMFACMGRDTTGVIEVEDLMEQFAQWSEMFKKIAYKEEYQGETDL